VFTEEQVQDLESIAVQIAAGLEGADEDHDLQCFAVETLDVRARLAVEEGGKAVHAQCILGDEGVISYISYHSWIETQSTTRVGSEDTDGAPVNTPFSSPRVRYDTHIEPRQRVLEQRSALTRANASFFL